MNKSKRALVWIIAVFLMAGVLAESGAARKGSKGSGGRSRSSRGTQSVRRSSARPQRRSGGAGVRSQRRSSGAKHSHRSRPKAAGRAYKPRSSHRAPAAVRAPSHLRRSREIQSRSGASFRSGKTTVGKRATGVQRRSTGVRSPGHRATTGRTGVGRRLSDRGSGERRAIDRTGRRTQTSITRGRQNSGRIGARDHLRNRVYPGSGHDTRQHLNRRRHIPARYTISRHDRRRINYHHNRRHKFVGHYPFYHRKYIFFSFGGYWPVDYLYRRYYWYGYHPYYWYGRYPTIYSSGNYGVGYYSYEPSGVYDDFADVRDRLYGAESEPPDDVTSADIYFEAGVQAFERAQYALSAEKFGYAMELAPADIILPFAYAQALFADGRYLAAVSVVRRALTNLPADQPTVFYPRGLYADEAMLKTQIERLSHALSQRPGDYDLSLLLGYHLLGVDRADEARTYLARAALAQNNEHAAGVLVDLLDERRK